MKLRWLAKEWEKIFYSNFRRQWQLRLKTGSWWGGWPIPYNLKKISAVINKIYDSNPEAVWAYFNEIFRQGYDWLYLYYLWIITRKSKGLFQNYQRASHEWYRNTTWKEIDIYQPNDELDYKIPIDSHTSY